MKGATRRAATECLQNSGRSTIHTQSTNLAIPAKSSVDTKLEDGLSPVSRETESAILRFVQDHGSIELFHFLSLGFRTGMRLGTIADLKIPTLQRATQDPLMAGFFRIQVGPNAHPPVATKGGVNGAIRIYRDDLDQLLTYATSTRRLNRQILASPQNRNLVLLTKAGRPYAGSDQNNYRAVEMELSRLRRLASKLSDPCLVDFHFHRSRASFGTNVARVLLAHLPTDVALQLLQELMLHANLETTLKYIKFTQTSQALEDASDAFTRSFLKLSSGEARCDP
ncbi:MAG: site-specific integrase [Nevskiaceae bacterium]|nr:MAG: site-specific integrase [Nevskiaceae bacterium]